MKPAAAIRGYGPADLASAYKIPTSTTTATISIVDAYDAPTVEADLANYRANYGLPACTTANGCFRKVNQDGLASPLPAPDSGWAAETTLDVQMVSAICPTCHILLVESKDDDRSGYDNMETAVKTATNMGARYVSMSWGGAEWSGESTYDRTYFNVPGVTYVAASGDNNYGTSWPAVNPAVVSVGGTSLSRDSSTRGWAESVWGYSSGDGTGSGCSSYEAKPTWQSTVSSALCPRRAMNDVSIVADPYTGVAVYLGGSWYQYGGTSAGTPMIAAMYAMTGGATAASPASYPYNHRAAFNDITDGANASCGNALCTAGTSWDGPSGVGTPIGLAGFRAPNTITVHNPGAVSTYAGSAVGINVVATDSGHLPVTYTATGLPPGASVRADGVIIGTPTKLGAYTPVVTARDSSLGVGSASFRWTIVNHHIVATLTPRITGTLKRGQILTASYGVFRQDSVKGAVIKPAAKFQWYLDGKAITGATSSKFTIPASYYKHRVSFKVTASATYYYAYGYSTARSALIG